MPSLTPQRNWPRVWIDLTVSVANATELPVKIDRHRIICSRTLRIVRSEASMAGSVR